MSKTVKELARETIGKITLLDGGGGYTLAHPDRRADATAIVERALVEHEKVVREEDAKIAESHPFTYRVAAKIRARKPADTEEGACD